MHSSDSSEFRKDSGLNEDFDTPAAAGVLYSCAGFVLLMGIITAETKYPVYRHYTTRQEISDLGGTRPPHGLVTQPSAMIFDATMLIAGVLLLAGAFASWRLYRDRVLTVVSALFGAGALGVGIFPATRARIRLSP
jgi:hypothetical membrane protein